MLEQELQQYLLSKYPRENEGCEWKEFKNLKNDFSGKAGTQIVTGTYTRNYTVLPRK